MERKIIKVEFEGKLKDELMRRAKREGFDHSESFWLREIYLKRKWKT